MATSKKKKHPPLIGVSACFFHADPERRVFKGKTLLYLEQSMAHYLQSQGAHILMIPTHGRPKDYIARCDGLVLQGGSDVSPKTYGEAPLRPEWSGDYVRDQYEIELIKGFIQAKKPILGICRGAQILNVALGGTLYQDIETQVAGSRNHRNWDIYDQNFHTLEFEKGSYLGKLYKNVTMPALLNTVHHQAIHKVAKDLVVEARCPEDGIIEAVKHKKAKYVVGVQWHPEFHDPKDKRLLPSDPLLKDFLKACKG